MIDIRTAMRNKQPRTVPLRLVLLRGTIHVATTMTITYIVTKAGMKVTAQHDITDISIDGIVIWRELVTKIPMKVDRREKRNAPTIRDRLTKNEVMNKRTICVTPARVPEDSNAIVNSSTSVKDFATDASSSSVCAVKGIQALDVITIVMTGRTMSGTTSGGGGRANRRE